MNCILRKLAAVGLVAVGLSGAQSAYGTLTVTLSGMSNASGDTLTASADFTVTGTTLEIVLTNLASGPVTEVDDVLDGLFFDIAGGVTLSDGQATLNGGSVFILKDNMPAGLTNSLNKEWMYSTGGLQDHNIGSTGFPGFNPNNDTFDEVFHGIDSSAGANSDYGVVSAAGITAGNASQPYVQNAMKFTFTLSSAISESDISNVWFSYGSSGTTVLTPEPATMGILAVGALAMLRRRRK